MTNINFKYWWLNFWIFKFLIWTFEWYYWTTQRATPCDHSALWPFRLMTCGLMVFGVRTQHRSLHITFLGFLSGRSLHSKQTSCLFSAFSNEDEPPSKCYTSKFCSRPLFRTHSNVNPLPHKVHDLAFNLLMEPLVLVASPRQVLLISRNGHSRKGKKHLLRQPTIEFVASISVDWIHPVAIERLAITAAAAAAAAKVRGFSNSFRAAESTRAY